MNVGNRNNASPPNKATPICTGCSQNKEDNTIPQSGGLLDSHKYILDGEKPIADNNADDWVSTFTKRVTYTIDNLEYFDDDTGKATVTVTAPNLEAIILKAIEQSENAIKEYEAEIDNFKPVDDSFSPANDPLKHKLDAKKRRNEKIDNQIKLELESSNEFTTTTFVMKIKKVEDEWKLVLNDDWRNAVTGNMFSIFM